MTLAQPGTGHARTVQPPRVDAAGLRSFVRRATRGYRGDLVVMIVYLLGGLYVTARLWRDLGVRVFAANPGDNTQFEWMLAHGARVVFAGQNPFVTDRMNVPHQVNLMANTSVLGLSVPLAPVTRFAGPDVSFAVLVTLALAGTAAAWYFVLRRYTAPAARPGASIGTAPAVARPGAHRGVVRSRTVAFVVGGLCGFAPGLVSHAAGQPNLVAQFLLPLIGAQVVRLTDPASRWVRDGVILGLLITWQVFINEELLLFTGLALLIFLGTAALSDPRRVRPALRPFLFGSAVAAGVAGLALAYPLYVQFAGPMTYQGLPFDPSIYSTDLATYFAYSRESLGGGVGVPPRFVLSANEENSFLGWPLLALAALVWGWLRRDRLVRASGVTAVVFVLLALGSRPMVRGRHLPFPGPYALLSKLPLFDLVTPTRLSLVVVPFVGLIVARGLDQVAISARRGRPGEPAAARRLWATFWVTATVAALLPIFPTPLSAIDRSPMPAFFSSGAWREMVPPGRTVVPVPLPANNNPVGMWWQANERLGFRVPGGYFLGPTGPGNPQAIFGAPPRPTATLLAQIARGDRIPTIGPAARAQAAADLRYWRAAILVLAPGGDREEALWTTVTDLVGSRPQWRDGVWVWDVRATS